MTNPLMFDGIAGDAAAIHAAFPNATMVGGYVDGNFEWSQADWDLFPNAKHVRISAIPGSANALTADVADCETGDYTAEEAAAWARAKKAAGYDRPTIYCNLSTAPEVRAATGNLILGQDYDMWAADPTGTPHKVTFSDGRSASVTQYKFATFYDASESYDSGWPHRGGSKPVPDPDPKPNHVPRPASPEEVTTGGNESLEDFAHYHSMTVQEVIYLTAVQKAGHGFGSGQGAYISGGKWNDNMPSGSSWWIGPTP